MPMFRTGPGKSGCPGLSGGPAKRSPKLARAGSIPNRMKEPYGKGVAIRSASSLARGIARCTAKRRQRIGGVGIQLRKDAIRTPTSLLCAATKDAQLAMKFLFHDCSPEVAHWALSTLRLM